MNRNFSEGLLKTFQTAIEEMNIASLNTDDRNQLLIGKNGEKFSSSLHKKTNVIDEFMKEKGINKKYKEFLIK